MQASKKTMNMPLPTPKSVKQSPASDDDDKFVVVACTKEEKATVKGPTVRAAGLSVGKKAGGMSLPPEIDLTIRGSHVFRFQAGAAAVVNSVSYADLCNLYNVGTGANKLQGTFSTIRLRSVTVWPALSTSTTDAVALEWSAAGEFFKDELKNRTFPEGQTITGALKFVPPPKSVAGFWHYSTNDILFYITAPSGSVCDVDLEFTFAGAYAPPSSVTTVGSVTVGNIYYGYLDGVSTHIWAPVINASQF